MASLDSRAGQDGTGLTRQDRTGQKRKGLATMLSCVSYKGMNTKRCKAEEETYTTGMSGVGCRCWVQGLAVRTLRCTSCYRGVLINTGNPAFARVIR